MTTLADELVPDELWALAEPLLPAPPRPPYGGRHRTISTGPAWPRSCSWPARPLRGGCCLPANLAAARRRPAGVGSPSGPLPACLSGFTWPPWTGSGGQATVPATPAGYRQLLRVADRHDGRRVWAIESTGGYGAGLTRF